jgi:HK97 family phage portal protein
MNMLQRAMQIVARWMQQPGEERIYIPQRQAGVTVNEDTALTYSAVWSCVRVISESIASLPWHVYRRMPDGRESVPGSMVEWLLNSRPNGEMTASSFREALLAHALTWGNGYAQIQRDMAGRPAALYLLTPDRVDVKRDDDGALFYEVRAADSILSRLPPEDVLHLHGLSWDGLVGYSPVCMAARSIGLGIAQDLFGQSFYGNGTTFGGLVEVPGNMTAQQIEQAEAYLNGKHGGPDKAFKVRVMAAGMKYTNVSMPMTDAQFLESRRFSVNEIARWYRVPPHKIADLERSTNNNIEHQSIEFVTDTLMPWIKRLEDEANAKLFGKRSQGTFYTRFAVNALMRGDARSRAEFYRTMTQIGAMTINEVRGLEELNGIGAAGDEQLVQLNQTTLEKLVAEPSEAKPTNPAPAEPAADQQPEDDTLEDDARPAARLRADTRKILYGLPTINKRTA